MDILTEVKERVQAPTPRFFQGIKKVGLLIAAIGLAILTAPGLVPELIQE